MKKLWMVPVTFTYNGIKYSKMKITAAAERMEDAAAAAHDEVTTAWVPCKIHEIHEPTLLWEPKKEEAK